MKKTASLFLVLTLMLASFTAGAQNLRGDCDLDNKVTISDVTALIDYILSGQWPEDVHEWVDLGLPSGTLWATCNVGATTPEDFGDYFAWGEVSPKEVYNWSTFKWCNGSVNTMTKYCFFSEYGYNGFADYKSELDDEDDAAYVNWGSDWRIPSKEQFYELRDNCTWQWTQLNGVDGQLVTGPNGNTMFLPAAGCLLNDTSGFVWQGMYWAHSCDSYNVAGSIYLEFDSGSIGIMSGNRSFGQSVRAVRVSQN